MAYTTTTITQAWPASVAMQWVSDGGKRRTEHPRKTWQQTRQGRYTGDETHESQLEWCLQSG